MEKILEKINILGTEYEITTSDCSNDPELNGETRGYIDYGSKRIVLNKEIMEDSRQFKTVVSDTIRHEALHGFFYESGLQQTYGDDEQLICFLEVQLPKMFKVFQEVGAI